MELTFVKSAQKFYEDMPELLDKGIRKGLDLSFRFIIKNHPKITPPVGTRILNSPEYPKTLETATLATKVILYNAVAIALIAEAAFILLGSLNLSVSRVLMMGGLAIIHDALDKSIIAQYNTDTFKGVFNVFCQLIGNSTNIPNSASEKRWYFFRSYVITPNIKFFFNKI